MKVTPIIAGVPPEVAALSASERVKVLSRLARESLEKTLSSLGLSVDQLKKDKANRPQAIHGIYWSVSHKPKFVCGVIARKPVGIDVEEVKGFKKALFGKLADEKEWAMFRERNNLEFARLWTGKEAVLKAKGLGIAEFLKCELVEVVSDSHLRFNLKAVVWNVHQKLAHNHVFSVAVADETMVIEWKE